MRTANAWATIPSTRADRVGVHALPAGLNRSLHSSWWRAATSNDRSLTSLIRFVAVAVGSILCAPAVADFVVATAVDKRFIVQVGFLERPTFCQVTRRPANIESNS